MPMSTRRSGRISLMLIRNHINAMVVIDIFPPRTLSSSRPMYVIVSRKPACMKEADSQVNSQISRLSSKGLKEIEEEQKMWQEELTKLRKIQPSATTVQELKNEGIPTLEAQVKEETTKLEAAQEEVEEVNLLFSVHGRDS